MTDAQTDRIEGEHHYAEFIGGNIEPFWRIARKSDDKTVDDQDRRDSAEDEVRHRDEQANYFAAKQHLDTTRFVHFLRRHIVWAKCFCDTFKGIQRQVQHGIRAGLVQVSENDCVAHLFLRFTVGVEGGGEFVGRFIQRLVELLPNLVGVCATAKPPPEIAKLGYHFLCRFNHLILR